ncbi:MAG: HutD family protein [Rubrivivax sp.]|nr:HutD family protein [Rubrivivax sp.]
MTLHRVHLVDCTPQPWRNGGGTTRELLAWPQAADWRLRVSVADIERDGPFSPFPGVERWFAVSDGEGVELTLPTGSVSVGPADAPVRFDGEAAPACRLLGGPSRDLNLMQRRGAGAAAMRNAHPGDPLDGSFVWRGLYVADDALLDLDEHTEPLSAGTLLWSDSGEAQSWRLRSGGRAWWLTLEA